MEAMNGECQEAIIGAFMHMHPDEIQLSKEQVGHKPPRPGLQTVTSHKKLPAYAQAPSRSSVSAWTQNPPSSSYLICRSSGS